MLRGGPRGRPNPETEMESRFGEGDRSGDEKESRRFPQALPPSLSAASVQSARNGRKVVLLGVFFFAFFLRRPPVCWNGYEDDHRRAKFSQAKQLQDVGLKKHTRKQTQSEES